MSKILFEIVYMFIQLHVKHFVRNLFEIVYMFILFTCLVIIVSRQAGERRGVKAYASAPLLYQSCSVRQAGERRGVKAYASAPLLYQSCSSAVGAEFPLHVKYFVHV